MCDFHFKTHRFALTIDSISIHLNQNKTKIILTCLYCILYNSNDFVIFFIKTLGSFSEVQSILKGPLHFTILVSGESAVEGLCKDFATFKSVVGLFCVPDAPVPFFPSDSFFSWPNKAIKNYIENKNLSYFEVEFHFVLNSCHLCQGNEKQLQFH